MNSPRSSVNRHDVRKLSIPVRGHSVSRSNNIQVDGRDDLSSMDARQSIVGGARSVNDFKVSSISSVSSSGKSRRDSNNSDERSISSVSVRSSRLTKEQVQLEEARAISAAESIASSRSSTGKKSSTSSFVSIANTESKKNNNAHATSKTYADEFLRAALAAPTTRSTRRVGSNSGQFPSQATLTPSQSSYISAVGRDCDDFPEITSIPTDEIVDSYTRPTIGEPNEENEMTKSNQEGNDEEIEKVAAGETVVRNSRDQYTFGRLQARASKRRELLQQVPEDEDVANYHSTARASRIKHIRSLYLPLDNNRQESDPAPATSPTYRSTIANSVVSPNKEAAPSPVLSPVESYCPVVAKSVVSPSNQSSPANHSVQSFKPPVASTGSPMTYPNNNSPVVSPLASPSNQSAEKRCTIADTIDKYEVPCYQSVATNPNSLIASTVQSSCRKSTNSNAETHSNSTAELSEYRAKLFAKMLHLLDDVEHPGLHTKGNSSTQMSHEYSVQELRLIQQRTEEEMSKILNEFGKNRETTESKKDTLPACVVKESHDDYQDSCSQSERPLPPNVMMSEAITSKLSDITSPTAYYLDVDASSTIHAVENEEENQEATTRTLPPRLSPRKKKTPVFPALGGDDNLPIVEEIPIVTVDNGVTGNEAKMEETKNKSDNTVINPPANISPKPMNATVMECTQSVVSASQGFEATMNEHVLQHEEGGSNFREKNAEFDSPGDEVLASDMCTRIAVKSSSSPQNKPGDKLLLGISNTTRDAEFDSPDDEVLFTSTKPPISPRNQSRDKLLSASRNAARRTVQKQRQQEEDRFHDEILSAVSSSAGGAQELNDEVNQFVATFDLAENDNEQNLLNDNDGKDCPDKIVGTQQGEEVKFPINKEGMQLHVPTHEQCGAGCVVQ